MNATARNLPDSALLRMTADDFNDAARCYRPDLSASEADADRFAELWNANKSSTRASVAGGLIVLENLA